MLTGVKAALTSLLSAFIMLAQERIVQEALIEPRQSTTQARSGVFTFIYSIY
jgi:hypothetical protein